MLQSLQKAKFSFQSAIIRNSYVSDYNLRFGNSKKPTQALKYKRLIDVWDNKLLQRRKKVHILNDKSITCSCAPNGFYYALWPSSSGGVLKLMSTAQF